MTGGQRTRTGLLAAGWAMLAATLLALAASAQTAPVDGGVAAVLPSPALDAIGSPTPAPGLDEGPWPDPAATPVPPGASAPPPGDPSPPGSTAIQTASPTPDSTPSPTPSPTIVDEQDLPARVDADRLTYDRERGVVTAEGDVVVTRGETVLAADRLDLERLRQMARAEGNVIVEDPEARIEARSASLELEDETGYLEDGTIYLPRTRFRLAGGRLEKGVGQTYHLWDGNLTTCLCTDGAPSWSISGDEIDVSLGGWGTVKGGAFRVLDHPILYLPYAVFPILRDRQSGLLFPRFGFSNTRGFQYEQPFYWAINKSSDATITADVETSARVGLLGEYRFARSARDTGILTATYFNETLRGLASDEVVDPNLADPTVPVNRWSVIGRAGFEGPAGSRIYAQPFVVSDNLFLREMNTLSFVPADGLFLRTRRFTTSRLGLVKVWDWGVFKGEGTYYQDLINKQTRVPQPLPRLTFQARQGIFDGRLRLGLSSEAVEYARGPLSNGPRFDLAPEVSAPIRLGRFAYGVARLQLRETAYYLFGNQNPTSPMPTPTPGPEDPDPPYYNPAQISYFTTPVPRTQHRELLQGNIGLSSEVSRVYPVEMGNLIRLKHTIEPGVGYLYIPFTNQTTLPLWDPVDRINARNLVSYGVTTRLLGKFRAGSAAAPSIEEAATIESDPRIDPVLGPPRPDRMFEPGSSWVQELGRAWIRQAYEISRPIDGTEHFSGVDVGLRATPTSWFGGFGQTVYSIAGNNINSANVGLFLTDWRPPKPVSADDLSLPGLRPRTSASVSYRFISGGALQDVNVGTTIALTDRLAASYFGRFDALDGRFLENGFGLRVISSCDCWVLDVAVSDSVNPNETQIRVLLSLVGLGNFGQQPFRSATGTTFGFAPPRVDPSSLAPRY